MNLESAELVVSRCSRSNQREDRIDVQGFQALKFPRNAHGSRGSPPIHLSWVGRPARIRKFNTPENLAWVVGQERDGQN
jgi:hypothetical protein